MFEAYFDGPHQIEQDRCVAIAERAIVELDDRGDELYRVCRVVPQRQLPALLKAFSSGPLHYVESVIWRRHRDEISIQIQPSMLNGRVQIAATYRLDLTGPGTIRRRYAGEVSVDVTLIASRIERGIVAEFERSMPLAARCTQAWLDRNSERSVTAQA